jgi:hypothetical protein
MPFSKGLECFWAVVSDASFKRLHLGSFYVEGGGYFSFAFFIFFLGGGRGEEKGRKEKQREEGEEGKGGKKGSEKCQRLN